MFKIPLDIIIIRTYRTAHCSGENTWQFRISPIPLASRLLVLLVLFAIGWTFHFFATQFTHFVHWDPKLCPSWLNPIMFQANFPHFILSLSLRYPTQPFTIGGMTLAPFLHTIHQGLLRCWLKLQQMHGFYQTSTSISPASPSCPSLACKPADWFRPGLPPLGTPLAHLSVGCNPQKKWSYL